TLWYQVFHEEGKSVTLECSYDSTNQYVDLYWYRQHPNKAPQYLLHKPARSSLSPGHISDRRFSSTTSDTSTQLTINGLTLADTALYYYDTGHTKKEQNEQEEAQKSTAKYIRKTKSRKAEEIVICV
uniref:Ig-like domain-containing protein n=1 Tax=Electrophorus electricus TaxID=8005 RepID=A0AAY5EB39_ELEEL